MYCIDCFDIIKICVKQLTFFERTVVAASNSKNCAMVHCDLRENQVHDFVHKMNYVRLMN